MNLNSKQFEKKVILITGAFGKIGQELYKFFVKNGSTLILIDKINNKDSQIYDKIKKTSKNQSIQYYVCDLSSESQRIKIIKSIKKKYKKIDILINNAAFVGENNIKGWNEKFENQDLKAFRKAIEINLITPFHFVRDLKKQLQNSSYPSILNVSSMYGFLGQREYLYKNTKMHNPAAYGSSKSGLIQLTRWLATTLSPKIRVNSISPGGIERNQDKKFISRYVANTPMKRMAKEKEIVNIIVFLSSKEASYITGQNIVVDGGFSIW
tara:strand:+ start:1016 stop:1816 length:801 start_codon:yes stop_codon:yes gene_type:complete